MALPKDAVAGLHLRRRRGASAILADGSVRQIDVFAAELFWDGRWTRVLVSALGSEAVVGMKLIAGMRLCIDVMPGGAVELTPLT